MALKQKATLQNNSLWSQGRLWSEGHSLSEQLDYVAFHYKEGPHRMKANIWKDV